jgi:predicted MFS family arabinose efflux permease
VGALLDRVGRRRVLLWSGALNTVSFPLFLLLDDSGLWLYVLATLNLVVGGALFAGYFTYAADLVPPGRRVEGIAIFAVAGMAPNGLGPALGELMIARAGFPGLLLTGCAFALLSFLLTLLIVDRPVAHRTAPHTVHDMLRLARRGSILRVLAATLVFGAGLNAAFFFVAPYTRALGIERAAPFYAAYASTTILVRVFGRRLPDRVGAHPIVLPSFATFALGLGLLCLSPSPELLIVAGMACGAGHGSLFPVLNSLAVARAPARLHGTVVGLYTGALDAGGVLGTPLCGAVARLAGYRTMFGLMAAASLGGLLLMAIDRRRPET